MLQPSEYQTLTVRSPGCDAGKGGKSPTLARPFRAAAAVTGKLCERPVPHAWGGGNRPEGKNKKRKKKRKRNKDDREAKAKADQTRGQRTSESVDS